MVLMEADHFRDQRCVLKLTYYRMVRSAALKIIRTKTACFYLAGPLVLVMELYSADLELGLFKTSGQHSLHVLG